MLNLLFRLPLGEEHPSTEDEILRWVEAGVLVEGLNVVPHVNDHCYKHDKDCPRCKPRSEDDGWVSRGAGSPCPDWSRAGKHDRINGKTLASLLLWVVIVWACRPHLVVHENVTW